MKRILITTYFFHPEITPRAFRAFELAKEFLRRDYEVDVVIPRIDYDFSDMLSNYNFNLYQARLGYFLNNYQKEIDDSKGKVSLKKSKIKRLFISISKFFFLGGRSFEYAFTLYRQLIKTNKKDYDIVLSIGLPISVHLGTSFFLRRIQANVSIADYGDPFSFNDQIKTKSYFKFIEKMILNKFDYITVPIDNAVNKFTYFKNKNQIKVIPQGFDFSEIKISDYQKNDIPTFAYAGVFYDKIRNPKKLFDFLLALDFDYRFVIYTDVDKLENMKLIKPYELLLGEKLVVRSLIAREECINALSKMDFIINQSNLGESQRPSKLIDYALAKRPIFNFNQDNFDSDLFLSYIKQEIDFKEEDLTMYEISNVVNLFEQIDSNHV